MAAHIWVNRSRHARSDAETGVVVHLAESTDIAAGQNLDFGSLLAAHGVHTAQLLGLAGTGVDQSGFGQSWRTSYPHRSTHRLIPLAAKISPSCLVVSGISQGPCPAQITPFF